MSAQPWSLQYIKLINDEELITWARYEEEDQGVTIYLRAPMAIDYYDEDDMSESVTYEVAPWIPHTNQHTFMVHPAIIMVMAAPSRKLALMYAQALRTFYGSEEEAHYDAVLDEIATVESGEELDEVRNWIERLDLGGLHIDPNEGDSGPEGPKGG